MSATSPEMPNAVAAVRRRTRCGIPSADAAALRRSAVSPDGAGATSCTDRSDCIQRHSDHGRTANPECRKQRETGQAGAQRRTERIGGIQTASETSDRWFVTCRLLGPIGVLHFFDAMSMFAVSTLQAIRTLRGIRTVRTIIGNASHRHRIGRTHGGCGNRQQKQRQHRNRCVERPRGIAVGIYPLQDGTSGREQDWKQKGIGGNRGLEHRINAQRARRDDRWNDPARRPRPGGQSTHERRQQDADRAGRMAHRERQEPQPDHLI
jgi:hypothetical protein